MIRKKQIKKCACNKINEKGHLMMRNLREKNHHQKESNKRSFHSDSYSPFLILSQKDRPQKTTWTTNDYFNLLDTVIDCLSQVKQNQKKKNKNKRKATWHEEDTFLFPKKTEIASLAAQPLFLFIHSYRLKSKTFLQVKWYVSLSQVNTHTCSCVKQGNLVKLRDFKPVMPLQMVTLEVIVNRSHWYGSLSSIRNGCFFSTTLFLDNQMKDDRKEGSNGYNNQHKVSKFASISWTYFVIIVTPFLPQENPSDRVDSNVCSDSPGIDPRVELKSFMRAWCQIWNHRELWYLCGSPSKLEDDNEGTVVK